jgi:hypothetical protein
VDGGVVGDPVAELAGVIDRLVELDPVQLADGDSVVGLHRQLERLAAVTARASAAFDDADRWQADGAHTASAWIATRCRLPQVATRQELHLGRVVRAMPAVEQAWLAGELSAHHVRVFARARTPRTAATFARDEEVLCAHAVNLPFRHLVGLVRYWQYRADPDGAEDQAAKDLDDRRFHHSKSFEGQWLADGVFDAVGGAIIDQQLGHIEQELFDADWAQTKQRLDREPSPAELPRTPAQRRADALVEMARRAGAVPAGARLPEPLFTVLVGYETFHGMMCQLANNDMVTPGRLLAHLDRAWIERIVFDGPSRVIDVGVRRRLFDGATRRAVEVAGLECFHETCETPAQDCEIDHIQPWSAGGPTTQDNGRPACDFHNRNRHNHDRHNHDHHNNQDGPNPPPPPPEPD